MVSMCRRHDNKTGGSKRADQGVSEVVGTLLLIGIGVTLFAILMLLVFDSSILFESKSVPTSNIIVHYDGSGNIVFENRGGDSVPLSSIITLTFADIPPIQFTAAQYLNPAPLPNDYFWSIGERVIYNASSIPNLNNLEIQALIVDPSSNSILLRGIIREGSTTAIPFVITDVPTAVTTRSEQFNLTYDYQLYYPHTGWQYWVRFSYKAQSDTTWTSTSWYNVLVNPGSYGLIITGLTPGTSYLLKGEACWGSAPSGTFLKLYIGDYQRI